MYSNGMVYLSSLAMLVLAHGSDADIQAHRLNGLPFIKVLMVSLQVVEALVGMTAH